MRTFQLSAAAALAAFAGAPAAGAAELIFACSLGAKRVEITNDAGRLTYSFGRPGRPEMVLIGDRASGNLFYHRTLFPHGETQTLRFANGAHSYLIFNIFQTPDYRQEGARDDSGLLVLAGRRVIARMNCRHEAELIEYPLFSDLPQDEEDLAPYR